MIVGGVIVGLVALCLCVVAVGAAVAAFFYVRAGRTVDESISTVPADPAQVGEQMDAIAQEVIVMRGLQPRGEVERKFLTEEEVRQRTLNDFNEDTTPEEWSDSERTLAALGLLPPNYDLYSILLRLYSEGVAGFYDPDTKELVVVSEEGGLNAYEKVTFAHEYNHALQDQNYDVRGMGFSDEGWETDSERAAAVLALLEGDSSLLEEQYQETLSPAEQDEYDQILNDFDVSIYGELPRYLLLDFIFPYDQGLAFVRRYYDEGGWARVDEVWQNPPVSTEHILHPERYEAGDLPLLVERPPLTETLEALQTGWREIESSVLGEWYTYLLLSQGDDEDARLSERTAARAAEGWGGDGYVAFYNEAEDETVLALHWVWDTQADADEFAQAFREYGDQRFGEPRTTFQGVCWSAGELNCFYTNGQHTLWITAPDQPAAEAILSLYPDF
jgi:hypothetical protein